jgi:hypothetical protein
MKLVIKNALKFMAVIALLSTLVVSCEDPYETIDYSKFEKEELKLFKEYLALNLDSLTSLAVAGKTLDLSADTNIVYFEMETGTGDSIKIGDVVGYRYTQYYITRDDETDKPELAYYDDNLDWENPEIYIAGDTLSSAASILGIDKGIRMMRHLGRSKIIIPSKRMMGTNYLTIVADIEVELLIK